MKFFIFLFSVLVPLQAYADTCVSIDSDSSYYVTLNCGFHLLPGEYKDPEYLLSKGKKLCVANALTFLKQPCMIRVYSSEKEESCSITGPPFFAEVVIRDDVFNSSFNRPYKICRTYINYIKRN